MKKKDNAPHTKGPWKIEKIGNTRFYYQIEGPSGEWIADVKGRENGEGESNAQLIADAPIILNELLQTGHEISELLDGKIDEILAVKLTLILDRINNIPSVLNNYEN